jgi:hypothetical protein
MLLRHHLSMIERSKYTLRSGGVGLHFVCFPFVHERKNWKIVHSQARNVLISFWLKIFLLVLLTPRFIRQNVLHMALAKLLKWLLCMIRYDFSLVQGSSKCKILYNFDSMKFRERINHRYCSTIFVANDNRIMVGWYWNKPAFRCRHGLVNMSLDIGGGFDHRWGLFPPCYLTSCLTSHTETIFTHSNSDLTS